ncbi:hypothetical protein [Amycolatopsis sp. NPDC050768]|uniref:hypothetical protein n=1 Tax=Amycolatopsis sp. NPDC050768 TaxID=3154839 RepID=UPI0033CCFFD4
MASLGATFSALYQWAVERGADKLTAQRRARALGDPHRQLVAAEEDLAELRRVEFPAVSDGDWQAALDAVAVALDAADPPSGRAVQRPRTSVSRITEVCRLTAPCPGGARFHLN